jgi:hypothetical protein
MRFTLNPKVFTNKVLTSLSKQQNKATLWLVEAAKALTPEDTGLMLNSYRAERAMIEGFVSTSWVSNSATDKGFPYPVVVDRGVWGKIYKYQKPKWNKLRHVWVWVNTFSRAVDAYKTTFLSILKE